MPQIRDLFGNPIKVKRSRSADITNVNEDRGSTSSKNPSGNGEPCPVADRQGNFINRLLSLTKNKCFADVELERRWIECRIQKISKKGVLENLPGFLEKFPNYHPVQAIDKLDGYKLTDFGKEKNHETRKG